MRISTHAYFHPLGPERRSVDPSSGTAPSKPPQPMAPQRCVLSSNTDRKLGDKPSIPPMVAVRTRVTSHWMDAASRTHSLRSVPARHPGPTWNYPRLISSPPDFLENQTVFCETCPKHPEKPWQGSRDTYAPVSESGLSGRVPTVSLPLPHRPLPPRTPHSARRRSNRQSLIARSTQSPPDALQPSIPQTNPRRHE